MISTSVDSDEDGLDLNGMGSLEDALEWFLEVNVRASQHSTQHVSQKSAWCGNDRNSQGIKTKRHEEQEK